MILIIGRIVLGTTVIKTLHLFKTLIKTSVHFRRIGRVILDESSKMDASMDGQARTACTRSPMSQMQDTEAYLSFLGLLISNEQFCRFLINIHATKFIGRSSSGQKRGLRSCPQNSLYSQYNYHQNYWKLTHILPDFPFLSFLCSLSLSLFPKAFFFNKFISELQLQCLTLIIKSNLYCFHL